MSNVYNGGEAIMRASVKWMVLDPIPAPKVDGELMAEHEAGEHSDFVYMDCDACAAEWKEITK